MLFIITSKNQKLLIIFTFITELSPLFFQDYPSCYSFLFFKLSLKEENSAISVSKWNSTHRIVIVIKAIWVKGAREGRYRMFPYIWQSFILGFRKRHRITGRIRSRTWVASGAQLTDVGVHVNTCSPRAPNTFAFKTIHSNRQKTIRWDTVSSDSSADS